MEIVDICEVDRIEEVTAFLLREYNLTEEDSGNLNHLTQAQHCSETEVIPRPSKQEHPKGNGLDVVVLITPKHTKHWWYC